MARDARKKSPEYPVPKKGERVKCLACNGLGLIPIQRGVTRTCKGCNGKGYFVA